MRIKYEGKYPSIHYGKIQQALERHTMDKSRRASIWMWIERNWRSTWEVLGGINAGNARERG
jgi:hypothetical protein